MATYYIDPGGDNGNDGSVGSPLETFYYACTKARSFGDIIHVNAGTFIESNQCELMPNVHITGEGAGVSIIKFRYANAGYMEGGLLLSGGSNTTQTISYVKFEGDSLTGYQGIAIYRRNNVTIRNCTIQDFLHDGVLFAGSGLNNQFYNNTVHNASGGKSSSPYFGDEGHALGIASQTNFICHHNVFTQVSRSGGRLVGNQIGGFDASYGTKIYNNQISTILPYVSGQNYEWIFAIELWYCIGLELYENTINGIVDLCKDLHKGSYPYSISVHDNTMGWFEPVTSPPTEFVALDIERSISDALIYNNRIRNVPCGIIFTMYDEPTNYCNNIFIHNNIFEGIGSPGTWRSAIWFNVPAPPLYVSNVFIDNNTIIAKSGSPAYYGIFLPTADDANHIYVRNNIIQGFSTAPVYATNQYAGGTLDYLYIQNNLFYLNGNSNNPLYSGITPTDVIGLSPQTNILGSDPLLTFDYHISDTSSPAYHAGMNVGLAEDYDGKPYYTPPSIGALESGVIGPKKLYGVASITFGSPGGDADYELDCVPDTDTFCLLDVVKVVQPSVECLEDAFAEAIAEYFDPAYEGDHTCLLNFRNYCRHRSYDHIYSTDSETACTLEFTVEGTLVGQPYLYSDAGESSITFACIGTGEVKAGSIGGNSLIYGTSTITFTATGTLVDKPPEIIVNYGALYNWYAVDDARDIANAGWHVVTTNNYRDLILFIDPEANPENDAAYPLQEDNLNYWASVSGTNIYGFNARGGGYRQSSEGYEGLFYSLKEAAYFWNADSVSEDYANISFMFYNDPYFVSSGTFGEGTIYNSDSKTVGASVRLVKDSTDLEDGETGTYTGNDGRIYGTICIGTQEWLSENLCETKYRNGDTIPNVTDNSAWAALSTGAMCYYNNDSDYGYEDVPLPQIRTATGTATITFTNSGTMPPGASPSDLAVTQPDAGDHLSITWTAMAGVTGYVLQRKPQWYSSDGGLTYYWAQNWKNIYVGTNLFFIDDIQEEGTAVHDMQVDYRVAGYTGTDVGPFSVVESFNWQDV